MDWFIFLIFFFLFSAEAAVPINVILSIGHSVFVKGDHTNFEVEPSFGVEASALYPDVKYTTVDEYLNQFVWAWKPHLVGFLWVKLALSLQISS